MASCHLPAVDQFSTAAVALMLLGYAPAQPAARAEFSYAPPTDDSLRIYAVDIWQNPPQSWGPGRGVHLGKGLDAVMGPPAPSEG